MEFFKFSKIYKALKNMEISENTFSDGDIKENLQLIVDDYFSVLKHVLKNKPVSVDMKELNILTVDGREVDLYIEIPRKDSEYTEKRMEIENLFADLCMSGEYPDKSTIKENIVYSLCEKIKAEW